MMPLALVDAADLIRLSGALLDPGKTSVFSIFRDEMYFAPAFFAHYRAMGVEQFFIFDDKSTDGTTAFLDAQPDCIRITSDLRYGDEVLVNEPGGKRKRRAGVYFKGAIPQVLMPGRFVTYVDADEFLILPPGVTRLDEITDRLDAEGATAAFATLVEFFPRDTSGFDTVDAPQGFDDLIAASPYFDAVPLLRPVPGEAAPEFLAQSKSVRLMEAFDLLPKEPPRKRGFWDRILGRKRQDSSFHQSPRHKTPIVRHSETTFMVGTHNINHAPSMTVMPTIAHFVFTPQFGRKVARALEWGSHANGASKYRFYAALLERLGQQEDGFLEPHSVRYERPEQLIACGLMRW